EQQKNAAESELEETRRALLKSRDETARFSSQLETERAQNEEQVRNIEQQKNVAESKLEETRRVLLVAESELEQTRRVLLKSRDETARLSGVLEIRNSNSAGLALYNARLRTRPEVSSGLFGVGVASKHGDPEMSAIADSILEDIERIGHPSFLWRMAKA